MLLVHWTDKNIFTCDVILVARLDVVCSLVALELGAGSVTAPPTIGHSSRSPPYFVHDVEDYFYIRKESQAKESRRCTDLLEPTSVFSVRLRSSNARYCDRLSVCLSVRLSVRLSVKRVDCDKTKAPSKKKFDYG